MTTSSLGPYRILERLGEGGMGTVFKAEDTRLHRLVALKILREGDDHARTGHRLLREARSASALNHPNICTVYEVSEHEGRSFIAMEWVNGPALSARIPTGGLPADVVARYGAQIARALGHAHDRGVIHRDLKASNVVLTGDDRPKIVDFGLASRAAAMDLETLTRSTDSLLERGLVGTLAYMAPELLNGGAAGVASDVWALGVLLYKMASGELPFRGETGAALAGAVLAGSPAPLPRTVPESLRAVIGRCLASSPRQRFARADEVAAKLEQVPAVEASPAAPRPQGKRAPRRRGRRRIRSLAVLPLHDLSKDPAQEYFVEGMTEALTTALARLGSVKVISRTSTMPFRGTAMSAAEIASRLNVDGIIEGTVLRVGDRVRISTQLIHAETDEHVWANSYDGTLGDVLALHSDVAQAVATEIRAKVARRASPADRRHVDPRAHEAYLKGRYHWSLRTADDLTRALQYFNEAVTLDPDYAAARGGVADYYTRLGMYHLEPPDQVFPKAKAAALQALERDPDFGEAHATLGTVLYAWEWNWTGAEESFERALQLNPSYAEAEKERALFGAMLGRFGPARAAARRAQELDPFSPVMNAAEGLVDYFDRRYDEAVESLGPASEQLPTTYVAGMFLGLSHVHGGRVDDGLRVLQRCRAALLDNSDLLAAFGYACGVARDRQQALDAVEELRSIERTRYVSPVVMAWPLVALGDVDSAVACLERAHATRAWQLISLNVDPVFDPIRDDPRVQTIRTRMEFPSKTSNF